MVAGNRRAACSWCSRSSVARQQQVGARGQRPDEQRARPALRRRRRAAPRSGSSRAGRASVEQRRRGHEHHGGRRRGARRARTECTRPSASSAQATVRPPSSAGRALSGCPSTGGQLASTGRRRPASGRPAGRRRTGRRQHAGDDGGRRRAQPAAVRDRVAADAAAAPARGHAERGSSAARIARTTRCASSRGTSPAPSPSTPTSRPRAAGRRPRARRAGPSASPSASKPGPRLALVAGTRTRDGVGPDGSVAPRSASSPSAPAAASGVDRHRVDRTSAPPASSAHSRVLEAVAGDGADDASAGRQPARLGGSQQPGDARRRRRLDEHALACGRAAGTRRGSARR